MAPRFCTIGHSNRTPEGFADILRRAEVGPVADVRSFPRSRRNPGYNIDGLPDWLACYQIGYRHLPALGGCRKMQPDVPNELNARWRNRSSTTTPTMRSDFAAALDELVELGRARRVAMMCSEAVWWRCHRRIIADHLLLNGHEVVHLMGSGRENPAKPTPGAERTPDGSVVYPVEP